MDVEVRPFLTRAELAQRWGMSVRTLENWARSGTGPEYRRFGHRAMYRLEDVTAHEARLWGGAAVKVSA